MLFAKYTQLDEGKCDLDQTFALAKYLFSLFRLFCTCSKGTLCTLMLLYLTDRKWGLRGVDSSLDRKWNKSDESPVRRFLQKTRRLQFHIFRIIKCANIYAKIGGIQHLLWSRLYAVFAGGWDLAVLASDSQCRSRNCPYFDPSILRHCWIWGAADVAVLNKVLKNAKNPPFKKKFSSQCKNHKNLKYSTN